MVAVAGNSGKACEYAFDNHYATPSHESHNNSNRVPPSTSSHCTASPIVASKPLVSSRATMAWSNPSGAGTLAIVATASVYEAISLLNGKDESYNNDDLIADGNSTTHVHMRADSSHHYQQSGSFQLWKCLETSCKCACLFKKMLLLVLIVCARKVKSGAFIDDECVDSGGSSSSTNQSSGGGSSSSGSGSGKKQQQNTSSNRSGSSSSSSHRSGSGSSQRGGGGGTGMGGGRRLSGSSGDSSDDGDDDDHNKRPRQQLNKEPKSKPDFDDEDDEETDSADEGGDDQSPRGMMLELNSPSSAVQNDNGGSMSSHGVGEGGGEGKGQDGRRGRNNIGSLPLMGAAGSSMTSSSRFSANMSGSGGATVESITLKEGIAGGGGAGGSSHGRIATTTLISSSQINSPVNMAVGYGVPVLAAADGDGLMTTTTAPVGAGANSSSSVPSSELGTPTQDSPSPPSPPHLGGGRDTPGTPRAMSPEITPNPQVRLLHIERGWEHRNNYCDVIDKRCRQYTILYMYLLLVSFL